MDFRECHRGICAKIHFDYDTHTFTSELVDGPVTSIIETGSYTDLHKSLARAVDDHLSGRDAETAKQGIHTYRLQREKARKEQEQSDATDYTYSHRHFLNFPH